MDSGSLFGRGNVGESSPCFLPIDEERWAGHERNYSEDYAVSEQYVKLVVPEIYRGTASFFSLPWVCSALFSSAPFL